MNDRISYNKHLVNSLGGVCTNCGAVNNLQLHHKVQLSAGGVDHINNLEILCKSCHNEKHNNKKLSSNCKSFIVRCRLNRNYYFDLIKMYPEFQVNFSECVRKALEKKYPLEYKVVKKEALCEGRTLQTGPGRQHEA